MFFRNSSDECRQISLVVGGQATYADTQTVLCACHYAATPERKSEYNLECNQNIRCRAVLINTKVFQSIEETFYLVCQVKVAKVPA